MKKTFARGLAVLALTICFVSKATAIGAFKTFDNSRGLPDNSVNCMRQDSHGYVWMGTWNGLCRFDGTTYDTFRREPGNDASLSNNMVRDVMPADRGVWVATDGGLDFFSFGNGIFHHCAIADSRGRMHRFTTKMKQLLVSGGRVMAVDGRGYTYNVNEDATLTPINSRGPRLYALCHYSDGRLIGVGPQGVYLLTADGRRVCGWMRMATEMTQNMNIYYSRHSDMVYVGYGIGYGSAALRITGNSIQSVDAHVPANLMATTDYRDGTIFATDGAGVIDGGAMGGGYGACLPADSGISGDAIYSLLVDRDNNLWIGTYRNGVSMYSDCFGWFGLLSRAGGALAYDIVTAVVTDGNRLYIGLDGGGLEVYDRVTYAKRVYTARNSNIPGNNVLSLLKDGDDVWMAVYTKGLVKYSSRTSAFTTYPIPAEGKACNDVWTICDDQKGNIWIGGPSLYVLNKTTGKMSAVSGMSNVNSRSIVLKGNIIWMASRNKGIYKIDRDTRQVLKHYDTQSSGGIKLPEGNMMYMFVDSQDNVWFFAEYAGLFSFNEKEGRLRSYGMKDGLANTNVTAIEEDKCGNLWMSTYGGLFRYDPRTGIFVQFDDRIENPSMFTFNASAFDGDIMYFGSTKGLVFFRPSDVHYQTHRDEVSFSFIELINDENRKLNMYSGTNSEVTLDHDQNFFSIHFSVPELVAPNRVHFSCCLKGLETGWRELSNHREVSYTNVPPGTYKFYVRCTDSNGRWGKPSVLSLTITPPWWRTAWATLLWTVLVLTAIIASVKFYLHELDIKHEMKISEIEKSTLKKLNEAKMNFYTNIIHELRTPVFLIAAQIEELLAAHKSVINVPSSYLYAMHRSSIKLNKLISRIIDFRKMDSDKLKLSLQRMDVVEFCRNQSEDYANLCDQKRISFSFSCREDDIQLTFDAEKLEMIISNLVSNAFKYTKEGGRVELNVEERADDVLFSVKDNGIGIPEKLRDNIFESFFRTEQGEKQSHGDGIGLSVVKGMVELHGGVIRVESEENKGSVFSFNIPKRISEEEEENETSRVLHLEKETLAHQQSERETKTGEIRLPVNPTATHSILIIDDDPETKTLLERNLMSDFKILKAGNGEEGLQQTREHLPDLIICDIMMPTMDGLEFLKQLKADKKLSSIKVIIFTAKTSEEDMLKAFDNGADAYLTKPISLKVLRKRIDRLVAQTDAAVLTNSIAEQKKTYTKEEQIFLLRCREIIDDNMGNEDFNIDFLADRLAMSHSSLYKKIKQMTDMSLIEFINDYKIYKAVKMFREGMTSIETVSENCGFKDIKNFREMFKRKMKITPKQFVQKL